MICASVGVDIGGTGTKIVYFSNGELSFKQSYPTDKNGGIKAVLVNIKKFCSKYHIDTSNAIIGFSTPGVWGEKNGKETVLGSCANLPWLAESNIIELAKDKFSVAYCYGLNDAKCQIYGQTIFGNAKGGKVVVGLTLGTGVGGAVIINGKIFLGASGKGGEFGHISIRPLTPSRKCNCGNFGCLEAYCGTVGIIETLKEEISFYHDAGELQDGERKNIKKIFELAKNKPFSNSACLQTIIKTAHYLADGLAPLLNAFEPDIVVFDGQISRDLPMMEKTIFAALEERLSQRFLFDCLKIVQSSDPEYSGAIGASAYALSRSQGLEVIMKF
ncbi:MAG: ROK family protein [Patescibacteria group bacterium]|jgi:glucokinase